MKPFLRIFTFHFFRNCFFLTHFLISDKPFLDKFFSHVANFQNRLLTQKDDFCMKFKPAKNQAKSCKTFVLVFFCFQYVFKIILYLSVPILSIDIDFKFCIKTSASQGSMIQSLSLISEKMSSKIRSGNSILKIQPDAICKQTCFQVANYFQINFFTSSFSTLLSLL